MSFFVFFMNHFEPKFTKKLALGMYGYIPDKASLYHIILTIQPIQYANGINSNCARTVPNSLDTSIQP